MPNQWFEFKQFTIRQDQCAMKVGTDAVLLGAYTNPSNAKHILDIGTGTGVIALMMAQKTSDALIDAIDLDQNAYEQALGNFKNSKWNDRLKAIHNSLQNFSKTTNQKYDLIVSNPPYFVDSSKAMESARTNARHADNHLPYQELLDGVLRLLHPEGKFYLILPIKEAELFRDMAAENHLYISKLLRIKTRSDKSEKRMVMRFEFNPTTFSQDMIIIEENERHVYSAEYQELTKDFYLHF